MASRLALASLVSQSASSVVQFCNYHLALGVDHIFLFFDYPEEANIPELASDPRVTITLCDAGFWKRLNVDRSPILKLRISPVQVCGLEMARQAGYRHVALIDTDEFLYSERPLAEALASAFEHTDVAFLYPEEAVHDPRSIRATDFSHRYFKSRTNRLNKLLAPLFYFRTRDVSDEGFLGHLIGKNIFRTDVACAAMDMHCPILQPGFKRDRTKAIVLLHFDCMQFDEWKRKWAIRFAGKAIPTMRDKRARQYEQIRRAIEAGDSELRALYERYYLYKPWQLRLGQLLGLIRKPRRLDEMLSSARAVQTPALPRQLQQSQIPESDLEDITTLTAPSAVKARAH